MKLIFLGGTIMKTMKKIASIALATIMVMSMMTGCGNEAAVDSSVADGSAAVESSVADEATGATFKIGGIGPITGGAAVYGQAVMNAAELAIAEINAAGGVNGVMFEMNFQDDEHDAEKSVNAYNTLWDWGCQMIVGCVTTAPCKAVAAEAFNDRMFMLTRPLTLTT